MDHEHIAYHDRPAVASGRFYPDEPDILKQDIGQMLNSVSNMNLKKPVSPNDLLAIIVPHAGYVFSGIVAASAYAQLKTIAPRKKVFLIGSSHCTSLKGASVYNQGNYKTPLGTVYVDIDTANQLIHSNHSFEYAPMAHESEHSLEVQLPFLQYIWGNSFDIVPIIVGTHNVKTIYEIAGQLRPWFNNENLFVISTDLSHYPSYDNAKIVDKITTEAILTGQSDVFLKQIEKNRLQSIENLATSICSWTSVLTLLYLTNEVHADYHDLMYLNSGDSQLYGDKERVVGYQSISVYKKAESKLFSLSQDEKNQLVEMAHNTIAHYLETGKRVKTEVGSFSKNLQAKVGAFVSIYVNNKLNGCIGLIEAHDTPLIQTIAQTAISSAFFDNRFPALEKDDLDNLSIEISVLTPLKKIESIEEIELGRHGILIRHGAHSGTFLPQVAQKTGWTIDEFLGHCSKDKAGLGWNGWKNADIYTYEAIIFGDIKFKQDLCD